MRHGNGAWNQARSFKDRLVSEVPGAYTQAFSFRDHMEDDLESNEEVEALREGVGHRKEFCLYIIRQESPPGRTEKMTEGSVDSFPCDLHANDRVEKGQGSTESVNGSVKEEATESTYGPWVVVTRRRQETRIQRNGDEEEDVTIMDINGPLLDKSLQQLVKVPIGGALKVAKVSPNNMGLEKDANWDRLEKDKGALKTNTKNSVKGKKALARARVVQSGSSGAVRLAEEKMLPSSQGRDGDQTLQDSQFILLTSEPWPKTGFQF
nr:hypothetical protein CFP56_33150 [Quercus suber]